MGLATLALTGSAGAAVQPNDPVWADQPGPRQIGLPQVWETTTGDPSVVIATIDTGANVIPDLQDAFVPGYDFVENDYEPQDTPRPRLARRQRDRRARQQPDRDGGALLGLPGDADPRERERLGQPRPDRRGDPVCGRRRRADHQRQPEPRGQPRRSGGGGREVRDRPRRDRGRLGRERRHGRAARIQGRTPACSPWERRDDLDALYFWSSFGPWVSLTAPGCQMVEDVSTPPGTICGTSFTPAVVAGSRGPDPLAESESHRQPGRRGASRDRTGRWWASPTGGSIPSPRSAGSGC